MITQKHHTDIVATGWINYLPDAVRPYMYLMRLDRPIGTWLLLLPGWWSILLAGGVQAWPTMLLFAIGALVMRGAGCVVNDLWDRDLDGHVERTRTRPIPAGDVTIRQALMFLGGLLCIGLAILVQFNALTIVLGVVSLLFVAIYPLMKRWTWWPQAFLGLTFNFGALMGWAAVTGELSITPWLIYAAGFFWTLGYDTIYALQDRADDALIGIKSTARLFVDRWGVNPKIPCLVFYAIHAVLMGIAFYPYVIGHGFLAFVALLPLLHLVWQVATVSMTDHANSLRRFKSNRDYGLIVCLVILFLS